MAAPSYGEHELSSVIAVMSRVGIRLFFQHALNHSAQTLQFCSVSVPTWRLKTQDLEVTRATQCCCMLQKHKGQPLQFSVNQYTNVPSEISEICYTLGM